MCEVKHDEVERLVKLRGDMMRNARSEPTTSYSTDYAGQRERHAWGEAKRLVERRIVEALGGILTIDLEEVADLMSAERESDAR